MILFVFQISVIGRVKMVFLERSPVTANVFLVGEEMTVQVFLLYQ